MSMGEEELNGLTQSLLMINTHHVTRLIGPRALLVSLHAMDGRFDLANKRLETVALQYQLKGSLKV